MNKNFCYWDDEEVKTLFKFVQFKKDEGVSLVNIFKLYGCLMHREANSVRNYYYLELSNLHADESRRKMLGIDLSKHKAKNAIPFSMDETNGLISQIDTMVANGYSVRRACLELSGGDATKMIRLQNKYRLEVKYKRGRNMGSIIKMPQKKDAISDDEINALFLGLIKLVKKQEQEKSRQKYESELVSANENLRQALDEIIEKNNQINALQAKLKELNLQSTQFPPKTAAHAIGEFVGKKMKKQLQKSNERI